MLLVCYVKGRARRESVLFLRSRKIAQSHAHLCECVLLEKELVLEGSRMFASRESLYGALNRALMIHTAAPYRSL